MSSETEILTNEDPGVSLQGVRRPTLDKRSYVGPVNHLADERSALLSRAWEAFDAQMLGATVGAVLTGLDLAQDLPDRIINEIHEALDAYKVIFFRDQRITSEEHLAFASRFGDLEIHPFIPANKERPELLRFNKGPDAAGYENNWHHDVTWRECPSKGTVLRAIEVPPIGGDTLFADMCAVYDGIDDDLKDEIHHLDAVHSWAWAFGKNLPKGREDEIRKLYPEVEHPVVCTHERTGRQFLYVNRLSVSHFANSTFDQSADLLDRLCQQVNFPEYQCRFVWEPDSIAFYDNRAVQHYANSDYWPDVRVMERASIVGERPRR